MILLLKIFLSLFELFYKANSSYGFNYSSYDCCFYYDATDDLAESLHVSVAFMSGYFFTSVLYLSLCRCNEHSSSSSSLKSTLKVPLSSLFNPILLWFSSFNTHSNCFSSSFNDDPLPLLAVILSSSSSSFRLYYNYYYNY